MLDRDFVDALAEPARESQETAIVTAPGGAGDYRYYLCRPGEEPKLVEADKRPRVVRSSSITGLCDAVRCLRDGLGGATVVYVGQLQIAANIDEMGAGRHRVSMDFNTTEQMRAVEELVAKPIGQTELVWLLRSTLAGCCAHPQFATMVRKLKIKSNEDGERTVGVGRESIGASVVREMSGIDGDLPETVSFSVPVFEEVMHDTHAAKRHEETVELAVRVDLERQSFIFKSTGSSVLDAKRNARMVALVQVREKLGVEFAVIEGSTAAA